MNSVERLTQTVTATKAFGDPLQSGNITSNIARMEAGEGTQCWIQTQWYYLKIEYVFLQGYFPDPQGQISSRM